MDLVDKAAFSPEERERLAEPVSAQDADEGEKATGEFEAKDAAEHASADSADEAK